MAFLNPTYLWGFLALLVPLAIHLLNQGDVKTIKVGSTQFLKEHETKQTKSVRLNELLLLLLRLLGILLIVLALCEPIVFTTPKPAPLTFVVEPSLLKEPQLQSFLAEHPSVPVKTLQEGLPEFDGDFDDLKETDRVPMYWQLAHELDALATDSIVIFSKGSLQGFKGRRPLLRKKSNWVFLDDTDESQTSLEAVQKRDSLVVLNQLSNNTHTYFSNKTYAKNSTAVQSLSGDSIRIEDGLIKQKVPVNTLKEVKMALASDEQFNNEKSYLLAALKAIEQFADHAVQIEAYQEGSLNEMDFLIWLRATEMPQWNGPMLYFEEDPFAYELLEPGDTNNTYRLTARLNITNVVEQQLTEKLLKVLDLKGHLGEAIAVNDKRVLPNKEAQTQYVEPEAKKDRNSSKPLSSWLWLALFPVLVVERMLSKLRKQ